MEFPEVCLVIGLGISKGSSTILWNIWSLSFFFSGISRGKVKKWKIPGVFQKSISSTPAWFFSGIAQHTDDRMKNTPNILCLGCKEQKECQTLIYILLQGSQYFSRLLIMISELITSLKHTFSIPFRINLNTIIMGTSSQFHDAAQLKLTHT